MHGSMPQSIGVCLAVQITTVVAVASLIVLGIVGSVPPRAEAFPGLTLDLPSLQWGAPKRADGSVRFWDPKALAGIGTNLVSVYYRPMDDNGKYRGVTWVIPPSLLTPVLENAKPELRESHSLGIKVIGYGDTIQFSPDVFRSENLDPEKYYALDIDGKKVPCAGWDPTGNYMSCLNNPHWLSLQKQINTMTAKAGFDAFQFDLYPYGERPGYHCRCSHCLSAWREYSRKRFGASKPIPGVALNLAGNSVDRAYWEWRMLCLADFLKSVQRSARTARPTFVFIQNHNVDSVDFAFTALHGGLDQPSTELSRLTLGNDSSLYLYRMAEAVNGAKLYSLCNSEKQRTPTSRLRVALAEAFAGGGALHAPAESDCRPTVSSYLGFVRANPSWFAGTKSDASVGILFSWRDHACLQGPGTGDCRRMDWGQNSCKRAAAALASKGIPYDYVIAEKRLKAAQLAHYRVIITPELKLLDDADARALQAYVRGGGRLSVRLKRLYAYAVVSVSLAK